MTVPIAAAGILTQAFTMMERSAPSSFSDESPEAAAANLQYPTALGMCLEDYDWSFARRLVHLPSADLPNGEIVDDDLPYQAVLPGDLLILRKVVSDCVKWRLDGQMLRFDQSGGINIRYTKKITNEAIFPSTFKTAISAQLAVLLMPTWVKSRTKKSDLITELDSLLRKARKNDRNSASAARLDGRAHQGDWADGATR